MIFNSSIALIALTSVLLGFGPKRTHTEDEKVFKVKLSFANVTSDQGNIMVAIYGQNDIFLDESRAMKKMVIPAADVRQGQDQTITLEKGTYAIAVFHDLNENGKLDRNWFRYPTEPYGFSREVRAITGPPDFDEVAFVLKDDMKIRISLN